MASRGRNVRRETSEYDYATTKIKPVYCRDCAYWKQEENDKGTCRQRPPSLANFSQTLPNFIETEKQAMKYIAKVQAQYQFPWTKGDEFCKAGAAFVEEE